MNNLAVVTAFYRALLAGDAAGAVALLAEDAVLHVPGRHQLAGDYHGPAGLARFAAATSAIAGGGERLALIDVLAGHDHVAALCRVNAERPGRPPLDNRTVHVARVSGGRINELWFHNYDQHTVDAFWGTRQ
jgi:ketosteroid isomerase-like protein